MRACAKNIPDSKENDMNGHYKEELKRAAKFLGEKPDTIFVGQNAVYPGSIMSDTFIEEVPREKRLELPVFENAQMGLTIGIALAGFVPVSVYGRPNFLLYALGMLANQLDKIPHMSHGKALPKVIVKVMNGSVRPINPGIQHRGDFTEVFRLACPNIDVVRLDSPEQIFPAYQNAYERADGKSTILIEWGDYYKEK